MSSTRRIEYDLISVTDVFGPTNDALLALGRPGGRRFVVVDECVHQHHGDRIATYFDRHEIEARIVVLPGGEAGKTVDAWIGLVRKLDAFPIHRRDEPIIAIGGGVLTDIVAFVAASFRRGVPLIKVPSTLMGYVDASVGIKTGVNFNGHKNRLGSFTAPRRVLLDRGLLATLPLRHFHNGICEIIKLAVVKDVELFRLLERFGAASVATAFQEPAGEAILGRAITGMLDELAPDLYEDDLARKVDFGHTFSYGLEMRYPDRLLHGEAVLLDMLLSVALAHARRLMSEADAERVLALVARLQLAPEIALCDAQSMWESLRERTLHRDGLQRVPLPTGIGACTFVNDVRRAEIDASLRTLREWATAEHV